MEATADSSLNQAHSPLINAEPEQPKGTRLFNGAYAKEMAEKSRQVRKEREEQSEQAKLMVAALKAGAVVEPTETYRLNRLALIRSQLAQVDKEVSALLKDPKADQSRLKVILEASKALSKQEQELSGRPLPGSHRPSPAKRSKEQPTSYEPVD